MSDTQNAIVNTQDFWSKLTVKTNIDLPDLPDKYRSDDGSFLIGMAKEEARGLIVKKDGEAFPDDWITAETIDGAIFAYPNVEHNLSMKNGMNYGSADDIDAKAFGLIVSLMLYSRSSFAFEKKYPVLSLVMGKGYQLLHSSFYSLLDVALFPDEISDTGDDLQKERLALFKDITNAQKEALEHMSTGIYSITN